MATPVLVVVITVAVLTVIIVAVMTLFMVQSIKRLKASVSELQEQVLPSVERLQAETAVVQRQLEQVSEAAQEISPKR